MSDDEVLVAIFSLVAGVIGWRSWYCRLLRLYAPGCPAWHRVLLAMGPPLCVMALAWAVSRFDSAEVRENAGYIFLFTTVGAVVLWLTLPLLNLLGLDVLGQAVGQRNAAVIPAIVGAWLAVLALNIGANFGEGETIYTALGPLALAGALLAGFVLLVGTMTKVSDTIASGRNLAAGFRFGALLLGAGLPLAGAASGDWVSLHASLQKFMLTLPVLAGLLVLGWFADKMLGAPGGWLLGGLLPASVFVFIGAASIA